MSADLLRAQVDGRDGKIEGARESRGTKNRHADDPESDSRLRGNQKRAGYAEQRDHRGPQGKKIKPGKGHFARSEEHTSELQSRLHLVCRLLLEKKKQAPSLRAGAARTRGDCSERAWRRHGGTRRWLLAVTAAESPVQSLGSLGGPLSACLLCHY